MMNYFRGLSFMALGAVVLLSNSLCYAGFANENLSVGGSQNPTKEALNDINSDFLTASGPGYQWSSNQLAFTFDASEQPYASGTFKGSVTLPNRTIYNVYGIIGTGGVPVTLEIGPPTILGNYSFTFEITALTGTIDPTNGPYGLAQNLTRGTQLNTTFNVVNVGDQNSATFLNSN